MQHPQETTPKALSKGYRTVLFIDKRGIVELKALYGIQKLLVVVGVNRIYGAEHDRFDFLEAITWTFRRAGCQCHRIAYTNVGNRLYASYEVANVSGPKSLRPYKIKLEDTHLLHLVDGAAVHEHNLLTLAYGAFEDSEMDYDSSIRVVVAIEDKSLERFVRVVLWSRYVLDYGLVQIRNALACLCRDLLGHIRVKP